MWKRLREWWLSRARAARVETPAAPDPPTPAPMLVEKFPGKAHDLDAARKSVEDAASVTTGMWLSYLFVLVYIGIAAGAVTHKDLFLENPVKLPFVSDVPLPLVAFFILAPIIFIVSHAYTLVHFVMLSAKVGVFNQELQRQLGNAAETKEYLRWQLPANIFVQILAGPARLRRGRLGFLSNRIAWISLVIGPVLLLLLVEVQFLPFHSEGITWAHRIFVLVDVFLLWTLWPAVVDGESEMKRPRRWPQKRLLLGGFAAIGVAITAATFPGEWLDEHIGNKQWIPPNSITAWLGARDAVNDQPIWTSIHDLLVNCPFDPKSQQRRSRFSNTLVLPGFNALEAAKIDDSKLGPFEYTFTRKNGHFEGAIFQGADLRKINLENAYLQGASLLQAKLQGAQLYNARLQGADLNQAKLQGASLDNAQLQGAKMDGVYLQGAWALKADLMGASLSGAQLQGTVLNHAQLQGTKLNHAQLQGTVLDAAQLQGASLDGAYLWRAGLNEKSTNTIRAQGLMWEQFWEQSGPSTDSKPWTNEMFLSLKKTIEGDVPAGDTRAEALKRIEILDPGGSFAEEAKMPDWRKEIEAATSVEPEEYKTALAGELKALACSGDADARYVVRGLDTNGRIKDTGAQAPGLVEAILKPDCPVSAALTDADKAALNKLKKEASGAH
jgi:uncharacterized protein YjbI with pentapeptide repeats